MSFTKKRWIPPAGLSAEGQLIAQSIQKYLLSLEGKGSLTITEATLDSSVVGGTNPAAGTFASVAVDDANFNLDVVSSNARITLDANDYLEYNRAGNLLSYYIGGTLQWSSVSDGMSFAGSGTVYDVDGIRKLTAQQFIPSGSAVPANGMYLPAANTVGFATNSTAAMRITSGQIVQAGTMLTGWGGGTTGEKVDIVGANSTLGGGGNLRVLTSDSMANDKGGAVALGGYYTAQTNSIDFAEISGRKENNTGGNTAGYMILATRVNGGNVTEAMRITSGQIVQAGTMPTWAGGTTGEKFDVIAANSTLGNGGNLRVITNDSQAIDKGGAITLGGYRTGTTSAIDFAEISGRKENGTDTNTAGYLIVATRVNGGNVTEALRISSAQDATFKKQVVSVGATSGIGYATGAGGTQTQLTSKSTTVTLNTVCGEITMHNATLNANTTVSFTLTNSAVAATDNLLCVHASGGTVGSYMIHGRGTGAGSATITVRNITAGNLGEAIVIRFTVLKGVTS